MPLYVVLMFNLSFHISKITPLFPTTKSCNKIPNSPYLLPNYSNKYLSTDGRLRISPFDRRPPPLLPLLFLLFVHFRSMLKSAHIRGKEDSVYVCMCICICTYMCLYSLPSSI